MELFLFFKLMSDLTPAQAKGFLVPWLYLERVRRQHMYQLSLKCHSLCICSWKTEVHRATLPPGGDHPVMPPQALSLGDSSCLLPQSCHCLKRTPRHLKWVREVGQTAVGSCGGW